MLSMSNTPHRSDAAASAEASRSDVELGVRHDARCAQAETAVHVAVPLEISLVGEVSPASHEVPEANAIVGARNEAQQAAHDADGRGQRDRVAQRGQVMTGSLERFGDLPQGTEAVAISCRATGSGRWSAKWPSRSTRCPPIPVWHSAPAREASKSGRYIHMPIGPSGGDRAVSPSKRSTRSGASRHPTSSTIGNGLRSASDLPPERRTQAW